MEKPWLWIGVPVVIASLALLVLSMTDEGGRMTRSGLRIVDTEEGEGPGAKKGDVLEVHYTGMLKDGKVFDSSRGREPFVIQLGAGQVIKGWDEGLVGMKAKGKRKLYIPAELGYGSRGAGGAIPPNADLIFDVELLAIK